MDIADWLTYLLRSDMFDYQVHVYDSNLIDGKTDFPIQRVPIE